jgi:hypothetical protein
VFTVFSSRFPTRKTYNREEATLADGGFEMRTKRILIALILCLMFTAVFSPAPTSAQDGKTELNDVVIAENDDETVSWILISEGDKVEVSVDVTSPSGGLVDVYVISYNQYSNYPEGSFTPAVTREGVSSVDFTFTVPDDQRYYLVIDNTDNSRASDTIPVGSVTVDYEYTNPWLEDVEEAIWTGVMFCILGLVIIVVIIVVVIVLLLKSGKKTPPAQPQQPYPPQQPYQQQPYQQPYQPPPGQQPPYQPPPGQPPGGQPPPQ